MNEWIVDWINIFQFLIKKPPYLSILCAHRVKRNITLDGVPLKQRSGDESLYAIIGHFQNRTSDDCVSQNIDRNETKITINDIKVRDAVIYVLAEFVR